MQPTGRAERSQGKKFGLRCPFCHRFKLETLLVLLSQSAVFAIGNSIFYNDSLYTYVEEVLSILVNLLNDSLAKTRLHSIAAIGNLANHKISDKMLSLKAPQKLLEVACHDTQFTVQEKALNVLNIFVHNEKAKKVSSQHLTTTNQQLLRY